MRDAPGPVPVPLPEYVASIADRAAQRVIDQHVLTCGAPRAVQALQVRFATLVGYMLGAAGGGGVTVYTLIRLLGV
jgi:hypothetical protein